MKKSVIFFLLAWFFCYNVLAVVHIHYLQKAVYQTEINQWGDWQNEANAFRVDSTTLSIVNLATKAETMYQRQGEMIGAYSESGKYYRLFEAVSDKGEKCQFFLYSDRNAGLLLKCQETGVMIQYAGY